MRARKWGYLFVLPGAIWYGLFMAYPMYHAAFLSLHRWLGPGKAPLFIGLENFKSVLVDPLFHKSFISTFYFTFMSVSLTTFTALFIAVLLARIRRFRGVFRSAFFLPSVIGVIAAGIIWTWCYQPIFGIFNHILELLSLPSQRWIMDPRVALFCVALMQAWLRLGFNVIVFLAGVLTIPRQFYEAAKVDGASRFRQLIHITLPLIMPITGFLLVYNTIYGLSVFGEVYMLTEGGPASATYTVGFLMYQTAFRYNRMGRGAGMALILFGVILAVTILQMKYLEQRTRMSY